MAPAPDAVAVAETILLAMIMMFHEQFELSGDEVESAFYQAMHYSPYKAQGF